MGDRSSHHGKESAEGMYVACLARPTRGTTGVRTVVRAFELSWTVNHPIGGVTVHDHGSLTADRIGSHTSPSATWTARARLRHRTAALLILAARRDRTAPLSLPRHAASNRLEATSRRRGIMNGHQRSVSGQHDGHALSVERIIDAPAEAIFDSFIALYDSQRPEWVTSSQLDLRPGGHWSVAFQVPDGPAFREERVITAVERPRRLAYELTAVYKHAPGFATSVEVTIEAVLDGHRIRLVQSGFPTTGTRDDFAGAWPDVLRELAHRVSVLGSSSTRTILGAWSTSRALWCNCMMRRRCTLTSGCSRGRCCAPGPCRRGRRSTRWSGGSRSRWTTIPCRLVNSRACTRASAAAPAR